MKKSRRKISLFVAGAMMLSLLAGCRKESDVKVKEDSTAQSIAQEYRDKKNTHDMDEFYEEMDAVYEEETVAEAVNGDYSDGMAAAVTRQETQDYHEPYDDWQIDYDTREFDYEEENKFLSVKEAPLSTFAADVDTASYSIVREYIENGDAVPSGAVRIEEMLNYFSYSYKSKPKDGKKFAVYSEYSDCPWNPDTKLLMVGINTDDIDFSDRKPSNIVFLIDTSGSMFDENKLPLAKKAFAMLTENLTENDRVSIVTYAGNDTVVLNGEKGNNKGTIHEALDALSAYGCTNGGDGIISAYEVAEENFIAGGNNRVILATDGDLNVGLTSESDLVNLISDEKENNIFLSVLGFGNDNLKDNKLESLADYGNGNYAFIDSDYEAKKVMVDEMGGNLFAVAKDVKFQIEFNPQNVKGYRQIGYENRALADSDFNDDTVDGGELGAGHMVTVIYEVVPNDSKFEIAEAETKYNSNEKESHSEKYTEELATINIRYKEPEENESRLESQVVEVSAYDKKMSADMSFAAGVAAFGMILRGSDYSGNANYSMVLALAEAGCHANLDDENRADYIEMLREQFIELVEKEMSNHPYRE